MSNFLHYISQVCVTNLSVEESRAVYNLADRLARHQISNTTELQNPDDFRHYLRKMLMGREAEIFGAIFLDCKNRIISCQEIFHGTIDSAYVFPREVVKIALSYNAASCVFFHNHPSGDVNVSDADKKMTKRLKDALDLVDINVFDHFVVGKDGVFSFAECGLI